MMAWGIFFLGVTRFFTQRCYLSCAYSSNNTLTMPSRFTRFLLLLALPFLLFPALRAQDAAQFRQAAQQALTAFQVPGFAVGIIKDGQVVLHEGFGNRTAGKEEPVDGGTLFAIASNTKAFIATTLAQLHTEGKVNLDGFVRDYLPYFQLYDEYVSAHLTVRDLLCHRAGLGTFSGDAIWYKNEQTPEEIIREIRYLPQAYEFRAGYGYSNLMFITAGEVIRAVTGQSWDQYVRTHYLDPLGMTRTQTSAKNLGSMANVATPHLTRANNQPLDFVNWDASGAAGGVISSVDDMLRWLRAQIQFGQVDGQAIFPEAVHDITWKPYNAIGNSQNFTSAGLGWFLGTLEGQRIVSHSGGYDGMYSQVKMIPELGIGVVVLTNSMTGLSAALTNYIVDSYLGRPTDGWLKNAVAREQKAQEAWRTSRTEHEKAQVPGTKPSLLPAAYAGAYHDPLFGPIKVMEAPDGLHLSFPEAPQLNARLTHWHYDTYRINWDNTHAWFDFGTVQFLLDNNRRVTGLQFDVPNDDIFFEEIHAVREE